MATKLNGKLLVRESEELFRGRPLMVGLSGAGIVVWPKGKRSERYQLSIRNAFDTGARLAAIGAAREREADKLARRAAR